MRVSLNLATRPFADLGPAIKRLRIGMGVLALLSLLLLVGLHAIHTQAEAARARDHSLDGQIAHINQERQGYINLMRQPDNARLLDQAAMLNKLIDDKTFSWTLAMEDLETVLPGGVQVTALEPQRSKDGRITTLHLRVVGPRDRAIDLVRNLEHSRRFVLPRIVGENAETNERPGQQLAPVSASDRVDFEIQADYNPATLEELKTASKSASKVARETVLPLAAARAARPLPLTPATPGRPAYPGGVAPMNRVPANGRQPGTSPGKPSPGSVQPGNFGPRSVQPGSAGPRSGPVMTPYPQQRTPLRTPIPAQPGNPSGGPQ